jgi:hypothetical protein
VNGKGTIQENKKDGKAEQDQEEWGLNINGDTMVV